MILLVVLTLSACDIDDNPYQEQREETSDVDIARVLQNTMSYFKKNGNDFSYLSTRGYEANDLRYKFSRLYRLNGNIIVQTPVVKRPHGSTAMIDSLKNEPVRTYTFTLLNPMYEIQKIAFAEQTPEAAYYIANRNRIFYDKFSGEQKDFATDNSIGNIIKYIDGIEIKTRGLKDTTIDLPEFVCTADSICDPNDTACFAGVILDDDTLGFGSDENTYGDGSSNTNDGSDGGSNEHRGGGGTSQQGGKNGCKNIDEVKSQIKPILKKLGVENVDDVTFKVAESICSVNARVNYNARNTVIIEICPLFFGYELRDQISILWHEMYHVNNDYICSDDVFDMQKTISLIPTSEIKRLMDVLMEKDWGWNNMSKEWISNIKKEELTVSHILSPEYYENEIHAYEAEIETMTDVSPVYSDEREYQLWKMRQLYEISLRYYKQK